MATMFDAICAWNNLWVAFRKAARGKRRGVSAAGFEHQVADRLGMLQSELRDKTYRPAAYCHFFIHEPKRRKISAAPFRDRVVHHALCNLIEPVFEAGFIVHSYANRLGKGTHRALVRSITEMGPTLSLRAAWRCRATLPVAGPRASPGKDRAENSRRVGFVVGRCNSHQRHRRARGRIQSSLFSRR